ncbi:hypothetical protein ABQJ54_11805 [Rhodanobacter sp. Si-c]|uniref:Uncharacterized protein n=1 Tax=Rhodanobacter lycopersici TaxID=3162487 RepID=A0ABV3QH29_9GAMM
MPLPRDPNAPRQRAQRPAQVLLNSPLAASPRMLGLRAQRRPRPRVLWRRVLAIAGSLLLHVFFLFAFILGAAWEPPPPGKEPPAQLQARFIELPDLAPPPPPKGEPPRQTGPAHQGHAAANPGEHRTTSATAVRKLPRPPAVVAQAAAARPAKAVAAPVPPPSVPQPSPTPRLQPVPLANQPPPVNLPKPVLRPPVPPKFQPQPVRPPQVEGNQPIPPPPSLAMPTLPPQAPPVIAPPSVALDRVAPDTPAPAVVQPVHVDLPAAPPAPELQAVPLPAPAAPQVSLQTRLNAPAPNALQRLPEVQAPAPVPAPEQPLAAIPQAAPAMPSVAPSPKATIEIANDQALIRISQPAPVAVSPVEGTTAASAPDASTSEPAATSATDEAPGKAGATTAPDVSTAPNANPQGRDNARPGEPQGETNGIETATAHGNGPPASHGLGKATTGAAGKGEGNSPGTPSAGTAATGTSPAGQAPTGTVPEFIQLKPTGDTTVMRHNINGVNYKATRFDPYWTPEGESSVDTALRHAAEKTTLQHTFHLPRGIRIKCKVMPLVPVALLGCGNADPPPAPVAQKVYDRLNLPDLPGGSVPSVPPPAPAASAATPAHVVLDNSVQCAEARVVGGPLPPGCPPTGPVVKRYVPATSASSWVPASDQFH